MIGRNKEYFFTMTKFLAGNLNNHRKDFPYINQRDDNENKKCISHQRHDRESTTEAKCTSISEIKLRGLYIKPEKCRESCCNHDTNRREQKKMLMITNERVEKIILSQKSSGKTIKTICDIDTICHRSNDKNAHDDISPTYINQSETWDSHAIMSEFCIKPPSTCK